MKDEGAAQAPEGVQGLWPQEGWGGEVERMSRQMGMGWASPEHGGVGGEQRDGGEPWEGGMPLVCAQGWEESCSVIIP